MSHYKLRFPISDFDGLMMSMYTKLIPCAVMSAASYGNPPPSRGFLSRFFSIALGCAYATSNAGANKDDASETLLESHERLLPSIALCHSDEIWLRKAHYAPDVLRGKRIFGSIFVIYWLVRVVTTTDEEPAHDLES